MPTVHLLLATFNGERHLQEQWQSLVAQEGVSLVVHAADDGSTDGTVAMLASLASRPEGAITVVHIVDEPPRRSATRSFMMLLRRALASHQEASWFAFCDQDDIWLPGKLRTALEQMAADADRPSLYGGRTLSVDEEGRPQMLSPLFRRAPEFRNALVQSIMGGNTIVLNRAAAHLVAGPRQEVTAHDWFSYQVVTAVGGHVRYDPNHQILYRQHADNVVGSNVGWAARWRRLRRIARGDFRKWNDMHVAALLELGDSITPDARRVLQSFERARHTTALFQRLLWLRRSGVFRQTLPQQIALWSAGVLKRL